jgi:hypothetical protein
MNKVIVFIFSFCLFSCFNQDQYNFVNSDFYINASGDSLHFPTADSVNKNSKFYFYNNKTKTQEIKILSDDTLFTSFVNENVRHEYFYKMRKAKLKESHNYNPLIIFKHGTSLSDRSAENLLCVKIKKYCKKGNLIEEKVINSSIYKSYSCNGNLYSKADSCNSLFQPVGNYTLYDTISNTIKIKGIFTECSDNPYTACESGWWEFYENGKVNTKKLYDKGRLIEEEKL